MVNDCVRIGLEKEDHGEIITSMRRLSLACYRQLAVYDLPTCYRLTAISKAAGILRNYRREKMRNRNARKPYAKKLMLTDCYGFRIFGRLLRIAYMRSEYLFAILDNHTVEAVRNNDVRSITLTASEISICYSKVAPAEMESVGLMGIDRNLDNITLADSRGSILRFDLSEGTRIKSVYREVRSHLKRNDARINRQVSGKYGTLQRNRVKQILHRASKAVVDRAKSERFGIVMEDLKGIRRLYRRGNGQGRRYRYRLNSWSYYELQRQIEYKARWEGIPVYYVAARGTSSKCSICRGRTSQSPNGHRLLCCQNCRATFDRDENAAKNILAKGGLRFGPDGPPGEAMVAEREQKEATLIRPVDGGKSVHAR
jgi:putative transposase